MKRLTTLSCLLILQLSGCTSNKGVVHCDSLTPCEILEKRRLTKDVHLDNSGDIYEVVAELLADQSGTVEPPPSGMFPELPLIWEGNPQADEKTFTVDFKRGTSVMKMLGKIAVRRGEHLTKAGNYVVITSTAKTLLPTCQQEGIDPSTELKDGMHTILPVSIIIREPEGEFLERFLSAKLQQTFSSRKNASAFRFVMSDGAKRNANKFNLIGTWAYFELCEALGKVADLRWRIEGTEVHLRDADEK